MTQQPQPNSNFKGLDISRARYRDSSKNTRQPKARENHWFALHRYAPEHASDWSPELAEVWYSKHWKPRIPIFGCACGKHWKELTDDYPPDFSSPEAFFEWAWARHNDVSTLHSHRPTITLQEAYQIYWPDCQF